MSPRLALTLLAGVLAGVVACASIAGLDEADPSESVSSPPDGGGGGGGGGPVIVADGSITSDGGLTFSPETLELRGVACDEQKAVPITITNPTKGPLPFELFVAPNDAFSLEGAVEGAVKGEIEPTGIRVVQLLAKSTVAGTASADIVVRAGETIKQINATLETRGAGLIATPAVLDFGDVRENIKSSDLSVVFVNSGNDPITIKAFLPPIGDSKFNLPTNVIVQPGTPALATFSMAPNPKADNPLETKLTLDLDGSLCGPKPTVALRGRPTNQSTFAGPPKLDFASIDCKATTSKTEKLKITNYRNEQIRYKLKPAASSKFAFASVEGTVARGPNANQATVVEIGVTVRDAGTTLGVIEEPLSIELLEDDGDPIISTTPITLRFSVVGAILQVTTGGYPGYADLVDIADNGSGVGAIRNVGNATTCVGYRIEGADAQYFRVEDDGRDTLEANLLGGVVVDFDAFDNGRYTTNVIITRSSTCPGNRPSAPFCTTVNPLPVSGVRNRP